MSFEPVELRGVTIDPKARLDRCKFCGRNVWWGFTARGRRNPFDVDMQDGGRRTAITHWSTCPQRDQARAQFSRQR